MKKIKNWFSNNKKTVLVFAAIFVLGIFLRTYEFHDWLRFSRDQVRDASLISNALENKDHLPFLGPNAGTTKFRLGPIYYYFSYVTEKIFGNYPDKMAYPSVFFSILSIPLSFLFLKEFFDKKISLALTAIMSVSYFLVINSRFSSNPNLIPFFILLYLYALLGLLNVKGNFNLKWSVLLGISMGVGIQLHTTLLIVMPVLAMLIFIYFLANRPKGIWRNLFVVLFFVLLLNVSQIMSEIDSHGQNTQYFIKGFQDSSNNHFGRDIFQISACQVQANIHIISSFGNDDPCNVIFYIPRGQVLDNFLYYSGMALAIIFSFVGYFLLVGRFFREKESGKKNFLGLIILFNLISFVILVPIAPIMFVGYFINLFMVPLILFGLMIEKIKEKNPKAGIYFAVLGITFLIISSLGRDYLTAGRYFRGLENNEKNATLSEVESIAQYITSNSKEGSKQYLAGDIGLAERFFRPVNYMTSKADIETALLKPGDEKRIERGNIFYYLKKNNSGNISNDEIVWGHETIKAMFGKRFSGLTVLIVNN